MKKTRKLPHSRTLPVVPVTGLRIVGRDQVYKFDDCCSKNGSVTIGRTNDRSIRLRDDDTISKLHCLILKNARGRYEIVDVKSTNGVKISDTAPYKRYIQVKRRELTVGMRIKLGDVRLVIVGSDGEPVIAASRFSLIGTTALSLFGSVRAAAKRIGLDDRRFKRLAEKNEAKAKAKAKKGDDHE